MQDAIEKPIKRTQTSPALGTRIRIKRDVHHHQAFLPKGTQGCLIYVRQDNLLQVQFDQPMKGLAVWKNTITFFRQQDRDALTWFHDECEVLE